MRKVSWNFLNDYLKHFLFLASETHVTTNGLVLTSQLYILTQTLYRPSLGRLYTMSYSPLETRITWTWISLGRVLASRPPTGSMWQVMSDKLGPGVIQPLLSLKMDIFVFTLVIINNIDGKYLVMMCSIMSHRSIILRQSAKLLSEKYKK